MRRPVCLYLLGTECLFLKMYEDESPIARRRRMNNERQARYRDRQPSDARDRQMQSLSVSGVNKKVQNNLKLGDRKMQYLIVYFVNVKVKLTSFY